MTVEASVIFPMVFGGIIFTIYLGIYLYNVSVIKQIAYISALRGSQIAADSSSEVEEYVEEQLGNLLDSKILMKENVEQEIKVSGKRIKVKLSMSLTVPWSEDGGWKIEREAGITRYNPVDIIREVRKANDGQISE